MADAPPFLQLLEKRRPDAARRVIALLVEGYDLHELGLLVVDRQHPAFAALGGLHVASIAEIAELVERFDPERATWFRGCGSRLPGSIRFAAMTANDGVSIGVDTVLRDMAEA